MALLSKVSLKHKLTLIIIATSMAALLLVGAFFLVYELLATPQSVAKKLSSMASVIGSNSAAALVFDDQIAAQETLNGLRGTPNIVAAYIYRKDGGAFVGYWRAGKAGFPPKCFSDFFKLSPH